MIVVRYLTREVVLALLVVTVVLLLAFISQQVVRYLNYVAIGKIPTDVLLQLVSFEVPYLLALLFPLGLYLGILLAYGRLYADNEIAILQMVGFGEGHITRVTLMIASVMMGIILLLMLWVNPWISAKRQQVMASDEATVHLVQTMIPGRFQTSPDGSHVMFVEKLSLDRKRAQTVFLAQEKKNTDAAAQSAWTLVLGSEGYQEKEKNSQEQFFVTTEGYRYEGTPGRNDYKIVQFKKYAIRIPPNDVRISHKEVETLSTSQLWQNYANPKYAAELQWRFSIGISAFMLALLAVPLSAVQPRKSRYIAFIPAVLVYIVYIHLLWIARRFVEQGTLSIAIGMWWVHAVILCAALIFILLRRKQWI